jgi:transporter family-2 protein
VPWWAWTGGVHGVVYVLSAIICAPTLGAGTFTGVSVCSMLSTALLLDHFGLAGFARKQIPWQKVVGALLMMAGAVLMSAYSGADLGSGPASPAAAPPLVDLPALRDGAGTPK